MKVVVFLLLVTSVFAQSDFRKSNWGDNINEVKKKEISKPTNENPSQLYYTDRLLTYDVTIIYQFNHENKLYQAGYLFKITHSSPDLYFNDYNAIRDNIAKKYGKGMEQDEWTNDILKDSPGTALLMGHYTKTCAWKTPKSIIILILSGDNYKASLGTIYESIEVTNEEKSQF